MSPPSISNRLAQLCCVLAVLATARDAAAGSGADGWAALALLIVVFGGGVPAIIILLVFTYSCARAHKRGQARPVLGVVAMVVSAMAGLSLPGFLFFGIVFDYTAVTTWGYFLTGCLLWSPVILLSLLCAYLAKKVLRPLEA